jgi:hypothetical protein
MMKSSRMSRTKGSNSNIGHNYLHQHLGIFHANKIGGGRHANS